jgi:hypothetical protein
MSELLIIGIQILVIVLIIWATIWMIRNNRVKKRPAPQKKSSPPSSQNLQDLINEQMVQNPGEPVNLKLENSSYTLDESLQFNSTFHLKGNGQNNTQIISHGNQPAIQVKDAKNCSIQGVRIKGAVQCRNGEVLVENCHIDANDEGVCIEAYDGSVVTFSGTVSSEGGIAIHAKGDSKVILKPPYTVSPDDYVVVDPRSKVSESEG